MTVTVPDADRLPIDTTSPTLAEDLAGILLALGLAKLVASRFTVVSVRKRVASDPGVDMVEVTTGSPHFLTNDDWVRLDCDPYLVDSYVVRSDDYGDLTDPCKFWLPVPHTADAGGGSWERIQPPE